MITLHYLLIELIENLIKFNNNHLLSAVVSPKQRITTHRCQYLQPKALTFRLAQLESKSFSIPYPLHQPSAAFSAQSIRSRNKLMHLHFKQQQH